MPKKNYTGPQRYLHCNMSSNELRDVFEYWNQVLGITVDQKLHANQARKTFCTLGDKLFKSEVDNYK